MTSEHGKGQRSSDSGRPAFGNSDGSRRWRACRASARWTERAMLGQDGPRGAHTWALEHGPVWFTLEIVEC